MKKLVTLGQKRPGEWFIFPSEYAPGVIPEPIPVPSWLVEQTPREDRDDLAKQLTILFNKGRRTGLRDGRIQKINEIKEALDISACLEN